MSCTRTARRHPHRVTSHRRRPRACATPATLALEAEALHTQRRARGRRLTAADVRRARDVVAKCATFEHVKRYSALGEVSCRELERRVGRRLSPTEERIYAVVRRAVRAGKAGIHVTVAELVWKVGRCERSVQLALDALGDHRRPCGGQRCAGKAKLCDGCERPCPPGCKRHVDLVRTVPQFDELDWVEIRWPTAEQRAQGMTPGDLEKRVHGLRQLANAYVLGRAARRPAPTSARQRAYGRHCTPKAFSSSLRSSEKQQPVDKPCGQPGGGGEGKESPAATRSSGPSALTDHSTVEMRRHAHRLAEEAKRARGGGTPPLWLELAGSYVPIDERPEQPDLPGELDDGPAGENARGATDGAP